MSARASVSEMFSYFGISPEMYLVVAIPAAMAGIWFYFCSREDDQ